MAQQQIVWTSIAAALVFVWLIFAVLATPKLNTADAIVVMQYGRVFGILSLTLALSLPTLLGVMVWYVPWYSERKLTLAGGTIVLLSLLNGALLIEVVRARVLLTADGITRHSPWTGSVSVKWSEVKSVQFSPFNRWFVIRTDSATIRVSQYLTGQKELTQALVAHVAAERRISCDLLNQ